jgi:hypothetical protein
VTAAALDRLLALLVVALAATGLVSLRFGAPGDGWLFAVHGLLGAGLAVTVAWKLGRSLPKAVRARRWGRLVLAGTVSLAAAAALCGGFAWVAGGRMLSIDSWTVLTIHADGLALVPLVAAHLLPRRWRLLVPGGAPPGPTTQVDRERTGPWLAGPAVPVPPAGPRRRRGRRRLGRTVRVRRAARSSSRRRATVHRVALAAGRWHPARDNVLRRRWAGHRSVGLAPPRPWICRAPAVAHDR